MPQMVFAQKSVPQFESQEAFSQEGYYQLSWGIPSALSDSTKPQFELQYSSSKDFQNPKPVYQGSESQYFVSGLLNGNHYFRVRSIRSSEATDAFWSHPLNLHVQHQKMEYAWGFFALGGGVFLATALLVIQGSRHHSRKD